MLIGISLRQSILGLACSLALANVACACGKLAPADLASRSPSPRSKPAEPTPAQPALRMRTPAGFVQSGFGTSLHQRMSAFTLMPPGDALAIVRRAISVSDQRGNPVPVEITAALEDDGMTGLEITSPTLLRANEWYEMVVSAVPESVELDDERAQWNLRLYTGHLVYVDRVMQPADPERRDEIFLRFSEPVSFDARWSTGVLADREGNIVPACVQMNGGCQTSGEMFLREAQLAVPKDKGALISRIDSGALHLAVGHSQQGATSATRTSERSFLSLEFTVCERGEARCAFL